MASDDVLEAYARVEREMDNEVPQLESVQAERELLFDYYDECHVWSVLARNAEGHWIAIDVEVEEGGGPASILVHEGDESGERQLLQRTGMPPGAAAPLLRRARRGRWGTTENLVRGRAAREFGLHQYEPLVELGGFAGLEGVRLFVQTVENLDQPEYVLIAQRPGSEPIELARREGALGSCDGDGYYCEGEPGCDEPDLRGENRLCVLPFGFSRVSASGESLALQGTALVAGHGGYRPIHWFIRIPDNLLVEE